MRGRTANHRPRLYPRRQVSPGRITSRRASPHLAGPEAAPIARDRGRQRPRPRLLTRWQDARDRGRIAGRKRNGRTPALAGGDASLSREPAQGRDLRGRLVGRLGNDRDRERGSNGAEGRRPDRQTDGALRRPFPRRAHGRLPARRQTIRDRRGRRVAPRLGRRIGKGGADPAQPHEAGDRIGRAARRRHVRPADAGVDQRRPYRSPLAADGGPHGPIRASPKRAAGRRVDHRRRLDPCCLQRRGTSRDRSGVGRGAADHPGHRGSRICARCCARRFSCHRRPRRAAEARRIGLRQTLTLESVLPTTLFKVPAQFPGDSPMLRPVLAPILLAAFVIAPVRGADVDLAALDEIVADGMKAFDVPGAAVVVVKDDKVVYLKGFGVREKGRDDPVTTDTVFAIASCSKAFTATGVAMLVADGKMGWDDQVRKHLDWFRLPDSAADHEVTIRDLLCHRTGMPRHDMLWAGTASASEDYVRAYGKAKPATSFRSTWEYANVPFTTAGLASGRAAGCDWQTLIRTRIFEPLGMKSAYCF